MRIPELVRVFYSNHPSRKYRHNTPFPCSIHADASEDDVNFFVRTVTQGLWRDVVSPSRTRHLAYSSQIWLLYGCTETANAGLHRTYKKNHQYYFIFPFRSSIKALGDTGLSTSLGKSLLVLTPFHRILLLLNYGFDKLVAVSPRFCSFGQGLFNHLSALFGHEGLGFPNMVSIYMWLAYFMCAHKSSGPREIFQSIYNL